MRIIYGRLFVPMRFLIDLVLVFWFLSLWFLLQLFLIYYVNFFSVRLSQFEIFAFLLIYYFLFCFWCAFTRSSIQYIVVSKYSFNPMVVVFVVILTKERHGEHKRFDRKTYIFK